MEELGEPGEGGAIMLLKRGDISGLEYLVSSYQVQAVRAAYLVCRDPSLAEDIVQSAFIRAYERIDQFDATRSFGPWFLRSVVNDALKVAARRERVSSLQEGWPEETGYLPGLEPGLENRLAALETKSAISAAIAQLPPGQRAAIVLRYHLGLSDSEMSVRLDCAPGTVRWRLHAARQRLRRLLPAWVSPAYEEPELMQAGSAAHSAHIEKGETR